MCNVLRYTGDSGDTRWAGLKGGVRHIGKRWPTDYDNDIIAPVLMHLKFYFIHLALYKAV